MYNIPLLYGGRISLLVAGSEWNSTMGQWDSSTTFHLMLDFLKSKIKKYKTYIFPTNKLNIKYHRKMSQKVMISNPEDLFASTYST